MFFGLLNLTLTWNRPQRYVNDKVVFTFLTHIIECLFIIATNHWVHCNAYKYPEMSAFVAWHFRCLREVYFKCVANRVPNYPFLNNRFIGVLDWVLKPLGERSPSCLVVRFGKSIRAFNPTHRLDVRFRLCWAPQCRAVGVSSADNVKFNFYRTSLCLTFLCNLLS